MASHSALSDRDVCAAKFDWQSALESLGTVFADELDESAAIYDNSALLAVLVSKARDWCLINVPSGAHLLGTRHLHSASSE